MADWEHDFLTLHAMTQENSDGRDASDRIYSALRRLEGRVHVADAHVVELVGIIRKLSPVSSTNELGLLDWHRRAVCEHGSRSLDDVHLTSCPLFDQSGKDNPNV